MCKEIIQVWKTCWGALLTNNSMNSGCTFCTYSRRISLLLLGCILTSKPWIIQSNSTQKIHPPHKKGERSNRMKLPVSHWGFWNHRKRENCFCHFRRLRRLQLFLWNWSASFGNGREGGAANTTSWQRRRKIVKVKIWGTKKASTWKKTFRRNRSTLKVRKKFVAASATERIPPLSLLHSVFCLIKINFLLKIKISLLLP